MCRSRVLTLHLASCGESRAPSPASCQREMQLIGLFHRVDPGSAMGDPSLPLRAVHCEVIHLSARELEENASRREPSRARKIATAVFSLQRACVHGPRSQYCGGRLHGRLSLRFAFYVHKGWESSPHLSATSLVDLHGSKAASECRHLRSDLSLVVLSFGWLDCTLSCTVCNLDSSAAAKSEGPVQFAPLTRGRAPNLVANPPLDLEDRGKLG